MRLTSPRIIRTLIESYGFAPTVDYIHQTPGDTDIMAVKLRRPPYISNREAKQLVSFIMGGYKMLDNCPKEATLWQATINELIGNQDMGELEALPKPQRLIVQALSDWDLGNSIPLNS